MQAVLALGDSSELSRQVPLIDRYLFDFAMEKSRREFPADGVASWTDANRRFKETGDLARRDAAIAQRDLVILRLEELLPVYQLLAMVKSGGPLPAGARQRFLGMVGGPRERTAPPPPPPRAPAGTSGVPSDIEAMVAALLAGAGNDAAGVSLPPNASPFGPAGIPGAAGQPASEPDRARSGQDLGFLTQKPPAPATAPVVPAGGQVTPPAPRTPEDAVADTPAPPSSAATTIDPVPAGQPTRHRDLDMDMPRLDGVETPVAPLRDIHLLIERLTRPASDESPKDDSR